MGATIAEKILARAGGVTRVTPGEIAWFTPDLTIAHDLNFPFYRKQMAEMGIDQIANPEKLVLTIDHLPYSDRPEAHDNHQRMREEARRFGIRMYDLGRNGISHNLPLDHGLVRPGTLVITSDTRSPALGCVGALGIALGAGFLVTMVTGRAWLRVPPTVRVNLTGRPQPGVYSRDIGEWVAAQLGPEAADYRVVEFAGPAFEHLGLDARHTLCNAMVDPGVKGAIVQPDAQTEGYVRERVHGECELVTSDADAGYEQVVSYDISGLTPLVSLPPDPENVRPVGEVAGRPIHQAFIGSCIGGKLEDLRAAARVLRGRKVADGVRLLVVPATHEIHAQAEREGLMRVFAEANAYVAVGACGPCYGSLAPLVGEQTCISTGTRNEPGRMGSRTATIYLASAATVAASAVMGAITDPREFLG